MFIALSSGANRQKWVFLLVDLIQAFKSDRFNPADEVMFAWNLRYSNWWFAYDVIKNMIMQIMTNLP